MTMKYILKISILTILIGGLSLLTVQSSPLNIGHTRIKRWFGRTTKTTLSTTTLPPPNDFQIGLCKEDDKLIYVDDTRLESNNATLGGVIEIYIDSPYLISCCKLFDQLPPGKGAIASFNANGENGGPGHKFIKINVQGQKHYGLHFKVLVYGNNSPKNDVSESNNL